MMVGAAKELIAPLKKYATCLEQNANKWIYNMIWVVSLHDQPYTWTYGRIRTHLIGLSPGQKP
jgi:hypothetical protein